MAMYLLAPKLNQRTWKHFCSSALWRMKLPMISGVSDVCRKRRSLVEKCL